MTRGVRGLTALGLATALFVAFSPAGTAAASLSPPVADCNAHNKLTHQYSASELENALSTMPADIQEYTDCYNAIQAQLLTELGTKNVNGTVSGGSGGSFLPVPVIIAIVVLAVAAAGLGAVALRRRNPPAE